MNNLFVDKTQEFEIKIRMPVLVEVKYLEPNPWNPNHVAKTELELLKLSIKKSGFCQPLIVIKKSDIAYMIVDGFHRHIVAKELKMKYIPVIVLDESVSELMACTIRFNRARGSHQIDQMSNIVKDLIGLGLSNEEIAKNLGMCNDEILRLKQNSGIADLFKDREYSKAWE